MPQPDARVIGIAGFMGSGKSVAAKLVARRGGTVIDADAEAKQLMDSDPEIRRALRHAFGGKMFEGDRISFAALGRVVFTSRERIGSLNAIVHPPLVAHLRALIDRTAGRRILDAALIPLWRIEDWFDVLLWLDTNADIRAARMVARDSMDEGAILRRMATQEALYAAPAGQPWRIVPNNGTTDQLARALDACTDNTPAQTAWGDSSR